MNQARNSQAIDRAVGKRLKAVRLEIGLTQGEVAAPLRISRESVAAFETGRLPMRYETGLRFCREFIVSEKWLATGKGEQRAYMDVISQVTVGMLLPDTSFHAAFKSTLRSIYEKNVTSKVGRLAVLKYQDSEEYLAPTERFLALALETFKQQADPFAYIQMVSNICRFLRFIQEEHKEFGFITDHDFAALRQQSLETKNHLDSLGKWGDLSDDQKQDLLDSLDIYPDQLIEVFSEDLGAIRYLNDILENG